MGKKPNDSFSDIAADLASGKKYERAKTKSTGSFSSVALEVGKAALEGQQDVVDIVTFVESSWGLSQKLFPVQRIILKAHYGIPLDDNPWGLDLSMPVPLDHPRYEEITNMEGSEKGFYKHRIRISDWRRKNWEVMSEADYLRKLHAEGRCNISEVVEGKERREMVLSIGRRSGKCKPADALVVTSKGLLELGELGNLSGPEVQPLEVGVAQERGHVSQTSSFYVNGRKKVRRLKTSSGFCDEGTYNHRIKVLGREGVVRWAYMEDIQVGDVVCINRKTNLWPTEYVPIPSSPTWTLPSCLDEDLGLLLGYLVGDESWNSLSYLEVTGIEDQARRVSEVSTSAIGHPGRVFKAVGSANGYRWRFDQKSTGVKGAGSSVRRIFDQLGYTLGSDVRCKRVPWSIRRSPKSVVASFLRGLFEANGTVNSSVSFTTASKQLAREVQLLLLNFGIVSSRLPKHNLAYGRDYYRVRVVGTRSLAVFADNIGFDSPRKQEGLRILLSRATGKNSSSTESIPYQQLWAKRLLRSIPKNKKGEGWGRSILREALGNTIKPSSSENMTYPRLKAVLRKAEELGGDEEAIRHFQDLQEMDYFFDPVVEVGEREDLTFDISVPDGHQYVANGMTNHNTQIAAFIAAYETYKLLSKGSPQAYYGLPLAEMIGLISLATDQKQAGLLYSKVSGYFKKCDFFKPYTANNTMSYAKFQTPADIDTYGRYEDDQKAHASIEVTFAPCRGAGTRGPGNILIILDEMAHFRADGQSSAETVYEAIAPSKSAFAPKHPDDPTVPWNPKKPDTPPDEVEVEGRIVAISSPMGEDGMFYKLFQIGMSGEEASENMLCIQAPTWEVNPTIPASEFAVAFQKDANVFFTEFGGQFTARTRGWIEHKEDLLACVDPDHRPISRAPSRRPHYVGLDFALAGDGTAIAIGHVEGDKIILDYNERIQAGEGDFESYERLDFDEVADWIYQLSRKFNFTSGLFDQWSGIVFEQALAKRGLKQLVSTHFTPEMSSRMYRNFKDMMWDERLVLYDWPPPSKDSRNKHCDYIEELLSLQSTLKSKYITVVEAPKRAGAHDDMSDALVRMIWQASLALGQEGYIAGSGRRGPQRKSRMSPSQIVRARRRLTRPGGSSMERQVSRFHRGRVRGR